jgi:hypothetical protein
MQVSLVLEVPIDILNHFWFWIQVAVSILKPPHGGFRSKMVVTYHTIAVSEAKRL